MLNLTLIKVKMLKNTLIKAAKVFNTPLILCGSSAVISFSLQVEFYRNELKLINCQEKNEINHSSQFFGHHYHHYHYLKIKGNKTSSFLIFYLLCSQAVVMFS